MNVQTQTECQRDAAKVGETCRVTEIQKEVQRESERHRVLEIYE